MADLRYWLWLSQLNKLSPRNALRYLRAFPSVKALYLAPEEKLRQVDGASYAEVRALCNKDLSQAERIEETCRQKGVTVICLPDADYPDRLRSIDDPPLVLYIRGKLPPVDDRLCIGVVGTRKCTDYGRETASSVAGGLAAKGGVIVTGLAEGIDSAAAVGALRAHGQVIAVLGTGVDVVYPAWNTKLQETVGKVGALVSEYPPGTRATRFSFPQRNRIISGLSMGVAVVQAPVRSGSLITAARAQEQGRDVFVVPGAVDDPSFQGSNDLIRDGAILIRSSEDVLEEYRFRCPQLIRSKPEAFLSGSTESDAGCEEAAKESIDKNISVDYSSLSEQLNSLTEDELKVVGALAQGECFSDEVIQRCGLSAGSCMAALTMLQLKGYVQDQGGRFRLAVQYYSK